MARKPAKLPERHYVHIKHARIGGSGEVRHDPLHPAVIQVPHDVEHPDAPRHALGGRKNRTRSLAGRNPGRWRIVPAECCKVVTLGKLASSVSS